MPPRKEYTTNDLRMICPNLYTTGKKARLMSNALEEIDIIGKLKDR